MLNIWGVMLFIRLSWIVGQAGIGMSTNGCNFISVTLKCEPEEVLILSFYFKQE